MAVPEFFWHCSRDSEIIGSNILEVFMSLSLCRRNAPNYWQNDGLLETFFPSIIWSLVTLCDTLITFRENYWLLRLIWRFSKSVSEYESVFWICAWIIIYDKNSILKFHLPCHIEDFKVIVFSVTKHLV